MKHSRVISTWQKSIFTFLFMISQVLCEYCTYMYMLQLPPRIIFSVEINLISLVEFSQHLSHNADNAFGVFNLLPRTTDEYIFTDRIFYRLNITGFLEKKPYSRLEDIVNITYSIETIFVHL